MKSRIIRNGHTHLLEVNGEKLPLYGYMSYQPAKGDYEAFREAGTRLFFTAVYAGDRGINQRSGVRPFRPGFWKGYGQYDFTPAEEDFRRILDGCKPGEAYLIPRLMVEPPAWWEEANPDQLCRDAQGTPIHQSYCSQKWREDTEEMMRAFQRWLTETGWAEYVPGWHIAGGNTEEYLRPSHHPMQFGDYSDCALAVFHKWLAKRYENVEKMNAAWHTAFASFEDAPFATPAQRMFGLKGALRDADLERQAIDTYAFLNEMNAQAVVDLCAAAKRVTGGDLVIGAFFGYACMEADIGHAAAEIVYESDAVDFLASPFTYDDFRGQGIDWAFPGCVESSMLHDKPWFIEADVRTCLSEPLSRCMPFADAPVNRAYDGPVWLGPDTVEGSLGQMTKAFARVLTHNTAVWWFDMWGGWYRDPAFMDFHRRAAQMYRDHALAGGSAGTAPIAVFVDDHLRYQSTPEGGMAWRAGYCMRRELGFVGTPYDFYSFEDFGRVNPAQYRLALFVCCGNWTDQQLQALQGWKQDGRVLVFAGPLAADAASGVTSHFDGLERIGDRMLAPAMRFECLPGDIAIASAPEGGVTALLRREAAHSVFVIGDPAVPAVLMRKLVCAAAGQVYCFDGDVIYASENHIAIHAASDGVKRICYPFKAKLKDAFTGEYLQGNESFAEAVMKFGETRLLEICRI